MDGGELAVGDLVGDVSMRHRGLMLGSSSSSSNGSEGFVFQLRAKFQRRSWRRSSAASTSARKSRSSWLDLSLGVGLVAGCFVLVFGVFGRCGRSVMSFHAPPVIQGSWLYVPQSSACIVGMVVKGRWVSSCWFKIYERDAINGGDSRWMCVEGEE